MGGGLALAAKGDGWKVEILHLTRGERGHPWKSPEEFGLQLEGEIHEAAKALGMRSRWSGLEAPLDEVRARKVITEVIEECRPETIVTHWRGSWHPSHVTAYDAVAAASSCCGSTLLFGENCEDLDGFQAEYFVSIGAVYEQWLNALRCYELFRLSEPGST